MKFLACFGLFGIMFLMAFLCDVSKSAYPNSYVRGILEQLGERPTRSASFHGRKNWVKNNAPRLYIFDFLQPEAELNEKEP